MHLFFRVSGGGSGGSIWIKCNTIKGRGNVTVYGGAGGSNSGGGGAGGRIAVYFAENSTYTGYFRAMGGTSQFEVGGAGTIFLYHLVHTHRTLLLDNGGHQPLKNRIQDYSDLSQDGCRTWILPVSGRHMFANSSHQFHFEELQIYGGAHLAILTDPINTKVSFFFKHMIGDRTGTIHIANNQVMDLKRHFLDLPFTPYIYEGTI